MGIYEDRHALMPIYPQGPRHMERLGQPTHAAESAHILGPVPSSLGTCAWLGRKPRWLLHVGPQWPFAGKFCKSNSGFCDPLPLLLDFPVRLPPHYIHMSYNMILLQT